MSLAISKAAQLTIDDLNPFSFADPANFAQVNPKLIRQNVRAMTG
jgi:hypothetical protein